MERKLQACSKVIILSKLFLSISLGAVHKLCRLKGGGGQKLPTLLSEKTTKRGGGGQKLPILRRHSLWTAHYGTQDCFFQSLILLNLLSESLKTGDDPKIAQFLTDSLSCS